MPKNYTLKENPKPPKTAVPGGETYSVPPPPTRGRIIGLDCHPDIYTAAVFRGSTPHDAQKLSSRENLSLPALLSWIEKECSSEDLFLMEAGSNSFEIYRQLLNRGMRAVVLESSYVGKHAKSYADDDKMAAARIVLVYLGGKVPGVWVPDLRTSERRELLHAYLNAVEGHTAATNSLKGYLNQYTIRLGRRGLQNEKTREWVLQQRDWSEIQRKLLHEYFEAFDQHARRRTELRRLIAREICAEPLMLRCLKLLGIGVINAFALLAIIGEVGRFSGPEKLVAYLGLNPGQRTSGHGKRIKLGTGQRGRGDMRALLTQSAQAVLRTGRNTALGKWGWQLFARKGHRNIAVAAVARKLAVQIWHLLSGNPPTMLDADKSLTLKLRKMTVLLGSILRAELSLPASVSECMAVLRSRILISPKAGRSPATHAHAICEPI